MSTASPERNHPCLTEIQGAFHIAMLDKIRRAEYFIQRTVSEIWMFISVRFQSPLWPWSLFMN